MIEAASQATPAVVYNVPGLKDSVRDGITGIIVKEKKVAVMAAEILALLKKYKKYKKYQKNCLQWAKKFNWDDSIKKSLKLLANT